VSAKRDELAVRKRLLVAQSSLYRAQLRYEVMALRARTSRASDWVGRAIKLVSIARTAISVVSFLRK
jgi:hypothetical protein